MTQHYEDFKQVVCDLRDLNQIIESTRRSIVDTSGVSYESQDARHVALEGMQCDISACGLWINALIALKGLSQEALGDDWEQEYLKRIETRLPAGKVEDLMLGYLRKTLPTKIHFNIEGLFANLVKHQNPGYDVRGFYGISNEALRLAGVPIKGDENDRLAVLAHIRNSFHNNGIHKNRDLRVCIDGLPFEFVRDKEVECAGWHHIVVVLRANVDVLGSVLLSPPISSIRDEIEDEFACLA